MATRSSTYPDKIVIPLKPSSHVIIMVGSKKNSAVGHSFVCIIFVSIIFPYPLAEGLLILLFCFCTVCVQMLPFSSSPKWNVDNKNIINCSPGLISAKWVEPFGDPPSHVLSTTECNNQAERTTCFYNWLKY